VILAVDVGGSHVKFLVSGDGFERRRFESGPNLTASEMVEGVARAVVPVEPEALDQVASTSPASAIAAAWLSSCGPWTPLRRTGNEEKGSLLRVQA
jgi:hypothetical protein